ncbi:MAG: carbohydrate ABC transporter permease, partial [Sphaerochaetaceae bacterium]
NIIPMVSTFYQSFHKTGDFGRGNVFVGFQNFQKLLADETVLQAIINTIKYTLVQVPFSVFIALILAVLLNRKIVGRSVYRTIYFLPMVVAPAAIAMIWRWLYNAEFGLINNLFNSDVKWISDPHIAIFSIAVIGIWSDIGYNMILFLAGLQEVPRDYYEAADLDGANGTQCFIHITVPMISPTLFFVIVTRMIAAMQVFDTIYMVMEKSNPALYRTQSLVYLFYEYSFVERNLGYGSTIVVVLLIIIMMITALQMIAQKKWVHYN